MKMISKKLVRNNYVIDEIRFSSLKKKRRKQ